MYEKIYGEIKNWSVSELREWILDEKHDGAAIRRISRGLTSEMVAAVAKLMSNLDLIYAAKKPATPWSTRAFTDEMGMETRPMLPSVKRRAS